MVINDWCVVGLQLPLRNETRRRCIAAQGGLDYLKVVPENEKNSVSQAFQNRKIVIEHLLKYENYAFYQGGKSARKHRQVLDEQG